jgi:hypothetical protein
MLIRLLCFTAALSTLVAADVKFTSPSAGQTLQGGSAITVSWTDSGNDPAISELTTYTIMLCAGGNDPGTYLPLTTLTTTGRFSQGNKITATIPANIGDSVQNAYFLQMLSVVEKGGTVTNFSPRFSLSGMTAAFPPQVKAGLKKVGPGETSGPATVNTALEGGDVPAGGVVNDDLFAVPFQEQTGLTRYAPMQKVPPTSITATDTKPLYPTSHVDIAQAYLKRATIATTLTQSQTFKVESRVNTAAPAPNPSDDMAKYLNRWKD